MRRVGTTFFGVEGVTEYEEPSSLNVERNWLAVPLGQIINTNYLLTDRNFEEL